MNEDQAMGWLRLALPTALSAMRLFLAATFPMMAHLGDVAGQGLNAQRIGLVIAAAASDWLDGLSARKLRCTTWWGGMLDAASDKVFTLAVLVTLTVEGKLAEWQLAVLLARDVAVLLAVSWLVAGGYWSRLRQVQSRAFGRATTVGLFVLFLAVLAWPSEAPLHMILFVATAALGILSTRDYWVQFRRLVAG